MTPDIERQFFDTFGIEPEYKICIFQYCKNKKEYDCENCNDREWHYPEITDRILLESFQKGLTKKRRCDTMIVHTVRVCPPPWCSHLVAL